MQDYKEFIKEVTALEVRSIKLLTEPIIYNIDGQLLPTSDTEIYPLSNLDPKDFTDEDLLNAKEIRGATLRDYWDLSHYSLNKECVFGSSYEAKLNQMAEMAILDFPSDHKNAILQVNAITYTLDKFDRFIKKYTNEKMVQYCNKEPFVKNTKYLQCDLRLKYLNFFNVTGIENSYSGYSPDFISQLYYLCDIKKNVLRLFKWKIMKIHGLKNTALLPENNDKKTLDPATLDNALDYIEPCLVKSFLEAEHKATNGTGNFTTDIRCATFCNILYAIGYLLQTKRNRVRIIEFARCRYDIKIKDALGKPKEQKRYTDLRIDELPALRKCFTDEAMVRFDRKKKIVKLN